MYDKAFYDTIRPGVRSSAAVVVPLVLQHVQPRTVIDVGCGEGWWAHEFAVHGCEVIGLDGAYVEGSPLRDRFVPHNLMTPLPEHLAGRFDLAVCLEVAEHLPADRADTLASELCELAPVVLFSAAIPGQGGVGHVNERWTSHWVGRFGACGYQVSGGLRWLIWNDERVEAWYRQNTLVAAAKPELYPMLFNHPGTAPISVVHPTIYDWRRQ